MGTRIFLVLWQLPQLMLGSIIALINHKKMKTKQVNIPNSMNCHYYVEYFPWKLNSGLSLGSFIFCNDNASELTFMHEQGHYVQSCCLGWLYLLVIGLPSIVWACVYRILRKFKKFSNLDYYKFYTEAWADKLAKIKRDENGNRYIG